MKQTIWVVALAITLASGPAAAQSLVAPGPKDGPYVGLSAGYLWVTDVEGEVGDLDLELGYDHGFAIAGQLGYKYNVFRLELEFGYARSRFDSIVGVDSTGATGAAALDGEIDIFTMGANLFYDFDNLTRVTPYFGGGIGGALVDVDELSVTAGGTTAVVEGDSETYFTAHGESGLTVALTEQVAIVPAYRFVWFNSGGGGIEDDTAHLFKMGVRFRL